MLVPLLLSSFAAGLIATAVMVFFLYLPQGWGGDTFDVVRAVGSALTGEVDRRSAYLGAVIYFAGGVVFAVFYGWLAALLIGADGAVRVPQIPLELGLPTEVNLFFPLLGIVIGLAHGGIVALFGTIVIIEHHPIERFRTRYTLIVSQIFSHLVYGGIVMFFHHQFLQLLLQA